MYHLAKSLKIVRASNNPAYSVFTSIKPFVTLMGRHGVSIENIDSVILNSFNVRLTQQHKIYLFANWFSIDSKLPTICVK